MAPRKIDSGRILSVVDPLSSAISFPPFYFPMEILGTSSKKDELTDCESPLTSTGFKIFDREKSRVIPTPHHAVPHQGVGHEL